MAVTVQTDSSYPNRVQLLLGSLTGPLTSTALGTMIPSRDLQVFVDGSLQTISSYNFDAVNNRYLIFTNSPFNQQGVVQVVYHMPVSPFKDASSVIVSGFCIIGTYVVGPPEGL